MLTLHTVVQQVWELLPAITTGLKFGAAALSFATAAVTARRLCRRPPMGDGGSPGRRHS
ncbi:hypothetical protein [Streptomyces sp. NPDC007083]|uniref:hypothetical protein n=1 Tax=Streptomyces sp. NPDC007083 TaxID=3156913 RepID=UPI0033EDA653